MKFKIDDDRTFYTVRDVAPLFGVTEYTVREWIKAGQLRAAKVGRMWLIYPDDLRQFVTERFSVPVDRDDQVQQLSLFKGRADEPAVCGGGG